MVPTFGAPDCVTHVSLYSGPLFLGYIFAYGLFGVLCLQVFMYYLVYPNDPRWLKLFVFFMFINEVVLNALLAAAGWMTFGSGYGTANSILNFVSREAVAQPALTGLAQSLFHGFYGWRVWTMTHSFIAVALIGATSASQFAIAVYMSYFYGNTQGIQGLREINRLIAVWDLDSVVTDAFITAVFVFVFIKHRKTSTSQPTVNKLEALIKFTVETGLLMVLIFIAEIVLWFASPDTFWWSLIWPSLPKIYSNTLMASLNSRILSKDDNDTVLGGTAKSTTGGFAFATVPGTQSLAINSRRHVDLGLLRVSDGARRGSHEQSEVERGSMLDQEKTSNV